MYLNLLDLLWIWVVFFSWPRNFRNDSIFSNALYLLPCSKHSISLHWYMFELFGCRLFIMPWEEEILVVLFVIKFQKHWFSFIPFWSSYCFWFVLGTVTVWYYFIYIFTRRLIGMAYFLMKILNISGNWNLWYCVILQDRCQHWLNAWNFICFAILFFNSYEILTTILNYISMQQNWKSQ